MRECTSKLPITSVGKPSVTPLRVGGSTSVRGRNPARRPRSRLFAYGRATTDHNERYAKRRPGDCMRSASSRSHTRTRSTLKPATASAFCVRTSCSLRHPLPELRGTSAVARSSVEGSPVKRVFGGLSTTSIRTRNNRAELRGTSPARSGWRQPRLIGSGSGERSIRLEFRPSIEGGRGCAATPSLPTLRSTGVVTSSPPPCVHACSFDLWRTGRSAREEAREGRAPRP